jgi:hypothetical protein
VKPASARFRERSCLRKTRYREHQQAVRMSHKVRNRSGLKLRSYRCELCGGWHLAKAEQP